MYSKSKKQRRSRSAKQDGWISLIVRMPLKWTNRMDEKQKCATKNNCYVTETEEINFSIHVCLRAY